MKSPLLKSRKFWIMTVDAVSSLVLYFATRYLAPKAVEDIRTLIITLQPIILLVVASITVQNVASLRAGVSSVSKPS
jgi:hypothetical protein